LRRLILVIFIFLSSFADSNFELYLYEKIFPRIFDKSIVKIYGHKKDTKLFKNSKNFSIVSKCKIVMTIL